MTRLVFCNSCGECMGKDKINCTVKHRKKHPNHNSFLVKKIIDPLLLDNPDEWFKKHNDRLSQRFYGQPKSNRNKNTDNETESGVGFCFVVGC